MRSTADVYINNEPFTLAAYQRSTANDTVSRFGSPEQGDTNLDLLKVVTQKTLRGGMFQRQFDDNEMAQMVTGGYFNRLDDMFYFTPDAYRFQTTAKAMTTDGVTAWCYRGGEIWVAFRDANDNLIYRISTTDGNITQVTIPAALQDSGAPISSMVNHNDYIFVACGSSKTGINEWEDLYRVDGSNTFTALGLTAQYSHLVVFREKLYAAGKTLLYLIGAEFADPETETKVDDVGKKRTDVEPIQGMVDYNNALYIMRTDGMYRFDGTEVTTVIDAAKWNSPDNFKHFATFNGRLYYTIGTKLFEFDGTNIQLIEDFTGGYDIHSIAGGTDRLWISAQLQAGTPSVHPDNDAEIGLSYRQYQFCYDGVGVFRYRQEDEDWGEDTSYNKSTIMFADNKVFNIVPDIPNSGFKYTYTNIANEFSENDLGTTQDDDYFGYIEVIGSEMDCGYPSIAKTLSGVRLEAIGLDEFVNVYIDVRYFNDDGDWSDWENIWNSESVYALNGIGYDYKLYDQSSAGDTELDTEPIVFKKMQYRLKAIIFAAPTAVPRFGKISFRYALVPEARLKWNLTVPLHNNIDNGTSERTVDQASALRKVLYDAYRDKLPILLYDVDWCKIVGYNSDDDLFEFGGTKLFREGDTIAVLKDDGTWFNGTINVPPLYDETGETTSLDITSMEHGSRTRIGGSSTANGLDIGYQARKSHAVYVTRVNNERYLIDDNTSGSDENFSNFESDITFELVEV